jgi:4-amino-4-deoxy-L-arabinose transferase-like glycosyltransferase
MRKYLFYLLLILLVAVFFRFYNLTNWLFFGMDQEYEALIIKNILSGKHFPLIGVNVGDTGLYLGPLFIYLAAIPYALFSGNPIGGAITASLMGVITSYFVYLVGKKMFNQKVGLFAALFYSGSFLISFYERKFWNPTPIPFFSLLIGFMLYKLAKRKVKYLPWLALAFGLAIQCHLSILMFLPLISYILWVRRRLITRKIFAISIIIFLVLQTPVVIFEFRHNFVNSKALVNLVLNRKQENASFSTLYERNSLFLSTLGRFFWTPLAPDLFLESGQCKELSMYRKNAYPEGVVLSLLGLGIFCWWYLNKRSRSYHPLRLSDDNFLSAKIIIAFFLLTLFFVEFYNRQIFEYYFLFLFPWLVIALGWSAEFIWKKEHGKLIIVPVILLFLSLNIFTLFTAKTSYSYTDKLDMLKFVRQEVGKKEYSLEAVGECSRYGGYRYLVGYFVGQPVSSYMDSYFKWLYPEVKNNRQPNQVVLLSMIDSRDKPETITKWEEAKFQFLTSFDIEKVKRFGRIQVYILSPRK